LVVVRAVFDDKMFTNGHNLYLSPSLLEDMGRGMNFVDGRKRRG